MSEVQKTLNMSMTYDVCVITITVILMLYDQASPGVFFSITFKMKLLLSLVAKSLQRTIRSIKLVLIASVRSIALVSREGAPSFASAPSFNRVSYFFRIKAESECGLILHSCFDIVRILLFPQRMFPIC